MPLLHIAQDKMFGYIPNPHLIHCKKGKVVLTQFGYLSFLLIVCIVKHSGVPLPALDSTEIKNLIRLARTLVDVMGEYLSWDSGELRTGTRVSRAKFVQFLE